MITRYNHVKIIVHSEINKEICHQKRKIIILNIISAIVGSFSVFGFLIVGNVSVWILIEF